MNATKLSEDSAYSNSVSDAVSGGTSDHNPNAWSDTSTDSRRSTIPPNSHVTLRLRSFVSLFVRCKFDWDFSDIIENNRNMNFRRVYHMKHIFPWQPGFPSYSTFLSETLLVLTLLRPAFPPCDDVSGSCITLARTIKFPGLHHSPLNSPSCISMPSSSTRRVASEAVSV